MKRFNDPERSKKYFSLIAVLHRRDTARFLLELGFG